MDYNIVDTDNDRQSFSRLGDDLCEVVLSYLPITDKLVTECVSKQFRRLVFNKQNVLILSQNPFNERYNTVSQVLVPSPDYKRLFTVDIDLLANLLKKLPNIDTLIIDNYCIINGQLLRCVADNCRRLRRFVCTAIKCYDMTDDDISYFGHSIGYTLRVIQFDCLQEPQMNHILKLTKDTVEVVNIQNNNFIVSNDFVFLDFESMTSQPSMNTELKCLRMCSKLNTIQITCYSVDDLKRLADFYSTNIKKIEIKFMSNYLLGDVMNSCLKQLSRFTSLYSLSLLIYNYQKGMIQPIDEGLRLIGQNCLKLEYFVCEMTKNLISGQLFDVFSQFSSLKSCKISTNYELLTNNDPYGTVALLTKCRQLKSLTLYLKYLSDKHLSDIHQSLPLLKTLKVNTSNGFIGNKTLHSLSQLSRLSTVEISGTSAALLNITDDGVCPMVANCPLLRQLCLFCKTGVSQQTIDQFITVALKYPKKNYRYFYELNHDLCNEVPLDYHLTGNNVPTNLQVYQI